MKYEIKKINNKRLVKVFAYFYFSLGLIASLVAGTIMILEGRGVLFAASTLAAPIAGFLAGGLSGFLLALIYNFIAKKFGGIIIEGKTLEK